MKGLSMMKNVVTNCKINSISVTTLLVNLSTVKE